MPTVICHDKDKNDKEFDSGELYHRPSVYGLLIKDDKILLSKAWDGYDFPGGAIELHEKVEQALVREFWEETGVEVKSVKLVDCQTSFFLMLGKPTNSTLIYYLCERTGGELSISNLVGNEKYYVGMPEWVPISDVGKIKFYNSVDSPTLIRQALRSNFLL